MSRPTTQDTSGADSAAVATDHCSTVALQPTQDVTLEAVEEEKDSTASPQYTWRFWVIFAGLALSALLSALEGSIISTALPTILAELGAGGEYIWVINIYFLTSAAFQPLYGQFADLWGRRWLMISSIAIFTAASIVCGAAHSTGMLIAGRGVQGIGAGGINMLVDVIICDLVPLRDRGSKIGLLFALITIMSSLGPLIGGALAQGGAWRWIFYLNVPLGGLALAILVIFLRVSHKRAFSTKEQLARIDFIGNGILIFSTTLIQYVLTYGGSRYPWSAPKIVALLAIGLVALVVFAGFETTRRLCPHPVMPPRLFANRTSAAAFFLSFNHAVLTIWATYFFPLYFQAVLGSSPSRSGVQLLPLVFVFPATAAIAGAVIAKTARFRPIHLAGFLALSVAVGCCSLLGPGASAAAWVPLELVVAAGLGLVMPALLPAAQAELRDADAAASTAAWAFVRSLGTIWGVSIPAAVFNNRFEQLLGRAVADAAAREQLRHGRAYEHASAAFVQSFADPETRRQVVWVYSESLKRVWQVGVVFAGTSFLAAFLERPVKLRSELETTEFGLEAPSSSRPAALETGGVRSDLDGAQQGDKS
ncbi:Tetracycline resistance protein TetB/drug resistance transporter [Macrophomina phaseolina MS6]|uniref:Tetracycline resistance protein TetB/drug resistance transporter n=1 Tax=Macrophomina phaseolina (strain MS6) TaxID=1126212 RepID=K2QNQ9_MACPH|nr:Tetracycline resistance protein TetB/drug resistance transporter [Macrophomina phaseolina MS6]